MKLTLINLIYYYFFHLKRKIYVVGKGKRKKRGFETKKQQNEAKEVEELLQAAQDELLLKLSFDSYISRVSLDYIDSDLDRCLASTQKISTFLLILILISSRVRQRRWKSFFKQSRTNCFSSFPLIPTSPESLPTTSTSILTVASKHSKNLDLPPHPHPHPLFLNLNLNCTN